MSYPETITIGGREYEINADYQSALACIACINDPELGDTERAYGVLELLYKEQPEDGQEAIRMAVKFLTMGKEPNPARENSAPDMDYEHDMHYIRSSFRSDYAIDLNERPEMHFWEFAELLQGLTDKCILNRVRDLRNYDLTEVKDTKTRTRIMQAQREVALPKKIAKEDQDALDAFWSQIEQQPHE